MAAGNQNKIVRSFVFDPDFVSCNTCSLNYCGVSNEKGFCQEFSSGTQPENEPENMKRAQHCKYWTPDGISRAVISPAEPEHERWYEKDSMA